MPRNFALLSIAASLLTLGLKFGAYWITGSVGMLSDAMETFVNIAASAAAFAALTVAGKPADEKHTYGHDKAEYFAGGLEGGLILAAAAGIVYSAVGRLLEPVPLDNLGLGMIVSALAALVNLAVARILLKAADHFDSITLEGDARHLLADVWTSAAVIAGVAVIMVRPEWAFLDSLLAMLVAFNVTRAGFSLIKRSVKGLMDAALPEAELLVVEEAIRNRAGAETAYHGLRSRKSGAKRFIDFHLLLPGEETIRHGHSICCLIEKDIEAQLPNSHVTIHVEPEEDSASMDGKMVGGRDSG